jgi:hypothetical protein
MRDSLRMRAPNVASAERRPGAIENAPRPFARGAIAGVRCAPDACGVDRSPGLDQALSPRAPDCALRNRSLVSALNGWRWTGANSANWMDWQGDARLLSGLSDSTCTRTMTLPKVRVAGSNAVVCWLASSAGSENLRQVFFAQRSNLTAVICPSRCPTAVGGAAHPGRRRNRWILPVCVFGRASVNTIDRGYL